MRTPSPTPRVYRMGEACTMLGISKGTMLRYEALAFFPAPRRNQANGYRYFTPEDIEMLRTRLLGEGGQDVAHASPL